MAPFELAEPRSLSEAFPLLQDDGARPLSGGTALLLMMKTGVLRPTRLVSLRRLGLSSIHSSGEGLRIGAMASLRQIEKSPEVRNGWPVIARTLRTLANVRVRNVATVGGALAHGDPHMDLPPLLAALGATATLSGPQGQRKVPVDGLYAGYLETTLERGELITEVHVPPLGARRAAYLKCTTRSADDWPALGMAVVLDPQRREASIVVSAATDRPTRLAAVEAILKGRDITEKVLEEASRAAREIDIEGDLHGAAAYKKHLIGVYLKRAVNEARNASN